jgi:hypothetical protein
MVDNLFKKAEYLEQSGIDKDCYDHYPSRPGLQIKTPCFVGVINTEL